VPLPAPNRVCAHCSTPVDIDQRYCIVCGERQVELPAHVCELVGPDAPVVPPFAAPQVAVAAAPSGPTGWRLPKPRDMAIAVLGVLGFGVIVGAGVTPAQSAAPAYIVAVNTPAPAPAPAPPPPADTGSDVASAPPVQVVTVAAPPTAAPAPAPAKKPTPKPAPAPPAQPTLPPVRHVFLIVLSDQGFNQSFGSASTAPYLSKTLTAKGELLTNYYAVAPGNLANAVALISGQGPTVSTTQNCPAYTDITPGTVDQDGQVLGDGCVYPKQALTIGDALTSGGHSWKAYVQGMGTAPDGTPATCQAPAAPTSPAADPTAPPAAPDPYAPWRNPWVYFHSLTDTPLCAQNDVGLEQLATDLKSETTTPSLSYIVPDLCHDGSDTPCAPGQPAGLAQADAFLQQVVPQILDSDPYKNGGMIAITFDQAPQTGENADHSGLADMPAYPNLPTDPATTDPATTTATTPTDPATTTPVDPTATAPADPAATTPTDTSATPTAVAAQLSDDTTTPTTTSTTPATTTTTPVDSGLPTTSTGGGHVGLLLLSPYVKPGTTNAFSYYNHFSLLKSIEALFGTDELGYSKIPTLSSFDATVWTNPTGDAKSDG
jgi:hypothetical protein